jgi:hypothetical protein
MKHLSRICSVAVLLVVFCVPLIIGVFRTQGTLANFSSANRQYKRKKTFECRRNLPIPVEGPQSGPRALPFW